MDKVSMYITAEGAAKLKTYIYSYNVIAAEKGIRNTELHAAVSDIRTQLLQPVYDFTAPETVIVTTNQLRQIERSLDWMREKLPKQITEFINFIIDRYGK